MVRQKTDYQTELERIEKDIAELRNIALVPPTDTEKVTKYVHSVYQHAVHTGNLTQLEAAEPVIDEGIRQIRFPGDLYFLKANLAFKLHRLDDVRRNLAADPSLLAGPEGQAIQADLDFQEGRYAQARAGYESVIASNRTWDNLARLAHFEFKMGDAEAADRLFNEAEDELTAKEMRSYAWVELQRGLLDLSLGRHDQASAHYERAERAYSGHWLVAEHKAELLGAQGRYAEAAALYQDVLERVSKPEIQQAFGELLTVMGEQERAQIWLAKAHAGYLDAAKRGGVHYYHHLVDFYADVRKDGAEAVKWARKDIALRDNFSSQAALAWALHRNGQCDEAMVAMNQALASGAKSSHLFSQAAAIYRAAGRAQDAERYAQRAAEINPRHRSFHVHR
jgi:tetratricopeptide (TPR) repeat protein